LHLRLPGLVILMLSTVLPGCRPADGLPTVRATRGSLPLVSVESGEIQAVHSQMVRPPMEWDSDLIVAAMVPEGKIVKQGDEVMRLDASPLERRLAETRDHLDTLARQRTGVLANQQSRRQALANAVSTATLSREQAELQIQKLKFEARSRQQGAQLALDMAGVALGEATAKLAAQAVLDSLELAKTDLELGAARTELAGLHARIAAMSLRAPLDGMVVYRGREDGEVRGIKPRVGDVIQPWQPLFEIPDLDSMQVEFPLHEVDRPAFRTGQAIRVRLEAYPESVFTGQIDDIAVLATEVEKESRARAFVARGRIAPADPRLRPGMTAVVEVELTAPQDTVLVPRGAVAEQDGATVVFPAASWPQPRPVRLGPANALAVAIVEGLAAGTELVLWAGAPPPGTRPWGHARHFAKEQP
jgi:HlyD family secretion protein